MASVEAAGGGSGRAVVLLVLFVLGCAAVAAVAAVGLGTVWEGLYAWVVPQVAGDGPAG